MERETHVFVDFTNEQQLELFKEITSQELVDQHIKLKTLYLMFNINSGDIVMIVGEDGQVFSGDMTTSIVDYIGLTDLEKNEDVEDFDVTHIEKNSDVEDFDATDSELAEGLIDVQ